MLEGLISTPLVGIPSNPMSKRITTSATLPDYHLTSLHRSSLDGGVRVLAGCAPCQPFSTYTNTSSVRTGQWQLLDKFGEIVLELQPEIVTMENVPRLAKYSVFENFLSVLDLAEYHYDHWVVRCAHYGVPQSRSRLVLLASKLGDIELVPADSRRRGSRNRQRHYPRPRRDRGREHFRVRLPAQVQWALRKEFGSHSQLDARGNLA